MQTESIFSRGVVGPTVKTSPLHFSIEWPEDSGWLNDTRLTVNGTVTETTVKWLHTKLDEAIALSKEAE